MVEPKAVPWVSFLSLLVWHLALAVSLMLGRSWASSGWESARRLLLSGDSRP